MEDNKKGLSGCCSMMLWDFLIIIGVSVTVLPQLFDLHIVFSFLIGAAASILLFWLMRLPVIGMILQIAMGIGWTVGIHFVVDSINGSLTTLKSRDPIWYWSILILCSIIFIILHIVSAQDYHGDKNRSFSFTSKAKNNFDDNEYVDSSDIVSDNDYDYELTTLIDEYDCIFTEFFELLSEISCSKIYNNIILKESNHRDFVRKLDEANSILDESDSSVTSSVENYVNASETEKAYIISDIETVISTLQKEKDNIRAAFTTLCANHISFENDYEADYEEETVADQIEQPSFFKGCDTLEKLTKRYKSLAKAYHPDTEIGDTETMQLINNEYERIKRELSK